MPTREEIEDGQSPLDLFPVIDKLLIDHLRERYPICIPTADSTEREDVYAGGQFSVIQYLDQARDYQLDRARKRGTPAFSPTPEDEEESDGE